jgi:hypothetical protein
MKFVYINLSNNRYIVGLNGIMFREDVDYISSKINITVDILREKFIQYGALEENNCYYFLDKEKAIQFIDDMNLILKLTNKGD